MEFCSFSLTVKRLPNSLFAMSGREIECDSEHSEAVVQVDLLFSTYFLVTGIMISARHWVWHELSDPLIRVEKYCLELAM